VTRAALDNARNGQGPTLIEAYTYRMGAHTSSDDPTRYRISSEVESWKAKDPISRLRAFLTKQKVAKKDFFAQVDADANKKALDLRERVLAMPDPEPVALFDHVYPNGSPEIDAQRDTFTRYQASFEGSGH
jgi:2-oxoisovalerate dehydrogenase E1 component alpha subunit